MPGIEHTITLSPHPNTEGDYIATQQEQEWSSRLEHTISIEDKDFDQEVWWVRIAV